MFFLHLDTLHFSAIPNDSDRFKKLRIDLLKAKDQGSTPFFQGCRILEGKKKTQYSVGLSFEGFNVFFADPDHVGSAYPIFIEVSAERMLKDWDNPQALLEMAGSCVGGFSDTKAGRCDITLDTDERDFAKGDINKFKTKSHTLDWISMGMPDNTSIKVNEYERRTKYTGFTFGSGCASTIYFRLYDKLEQLKRLKIDGSAIFNKWKFFGWRGSKVWRFEWELKRKKLKLYGVETIQDLYGSLNRIYKNLVFDWMVFKDRNNSKYFWSMIQSLTFNYVEAAPREFITKLDLHLFDRQIVGLLKRIAYEHKLDHAGLFKHVSNILVNSEDEICEWMDTELETKKREHLDNVLLEVKLKCEKNLPVLKSAVNF